MAAAFGSFGVGTERVMRVSADGAMTLAVMFFEPFRSEEHTSELQSLMRISYAVFCLKKKKKNKQKNDTKSNNDIHINKIKHNKLMKNALNTEQNIPLQS